MHAPNIDARLLDLTNLAPEPVLPAIDAPPGDSLEEAQVEAFLELSRAEAAASRLPDAAWTVRLETQMRRLGDNADMETRLDTLAEHAAVTDEEDDALPGHAV